MPVIEGTYGPILVAGTPGAGTTAIDTLTIDAAGGTFKLGDGVDWTSPAISWNATNATLVANVNAALQGTAEVQTITFAGTLSGTFRLRFRGQETAAITWSATNNTLRDNVDTALEALIPIGSGGVTTAVGTMTSGVGTLTVTFAMEYAPELMLEVSDNRTGGTITVARTTAGVATPFGKIGVVAAVGTMTAGVGTLTLTFSGVNLAKMPQTAITVEDNSLTGTATLTVSETTPGVLADGRGAAVGAMAVDTTSGKLYANTGTSHLPTWTVVGSQS
jgi:hypothetical protein